MEDLRKAVRLKCRDGWGEWTRRGWKSGRGSPHLGPNVSVKYFGLCQKKNGNPLKSFKKGP